MKSCNKKQLLKGLVKKRTAYLLKRVEPMHLQMSLIRSLTRLSATLSKTFKKPSGRLRRRLRKANEALFSKHLFATNMTISIAFSGLGDLLEQSYEILAGYEEQIDRLRLLKLSSTGVPIGIVCHYWYQYLDRIFPSRTGKTLVKKFIIDQVFSSPMYIILFYATLGLWNKWNMNEFKEIILDKGKDIFIAECWIWPPAQLINFYFLPTKYRLLYDSVISLGFDTYFSYVTHKELREKNKL